MLSAMKAIIEITVVLLLALLALDTARGQALPELEPASRPDIVILQGVEQAQSFLEAESWWGEMTRGDQLEAPRILLTGIPAGWQESSSDLPLHSKKEFFYRFTLPLILHANELIRQRRAELSELQQGIAAGLDINQQQRQWLAQISEPLEVADLDQLTAMNSQELEELLSELLYRIDEVPAGLALGQAAFESGYGTSRFAVEGNALFGQWTFDGSGLEPRQQREDLGDYSIATYNWPFESVKSYMLNLSRHPAYEEFRQLRAEARAANRPLDSLELAPGLINYSERGQEYVDTLMDIIEVNDLQLTDAARLRDEPIRYLIGTDTDTETEQLRAQLEQLQQTGEILRFINRMQLD
jgi:uncharacterized FlgJ-related protein